MGHSGLLETGGSYAAGKVGSARERVYSDVGMKDETGRTTPGWNRPVVGRVG
jgi:hypothetical protein